MDVRTCRSCRKIFNYVSGPMLCPACRQALEEKFQEVKKYIEDHGTATLPQIAEDCDVDVQQIRQWLREERLELASNSSFVLECESCGGPIRSGRFCDKCRASMANNMQSLIKSSKPTEPTLYKKDTNARMRFRQE
ncbi:MAG: flagellar protein [Lachnospiraceae bacterium]|nr:flagellar protein [Lachnospiraceae bacterium]